MADKPICIIDGCDKPVKSKLLCSKHHERLKRNGHTGLKKSPEYGICSVSLCEKKARGKHGWCSRHYKINWKYGSPTGNSQQGQSLLGFTIAASRSNTDECIVWPFRKDPRNSGQLSFGKTRQPATHYVMTLIGSPRPSSKHMICHAPLICKNSSCLNPRHMRWGAAKDNSDDQIIDKSTRRGTDHVCCKLNNSSVLNILSDARPYQEIADD